MASHPNIADRSESCLLVVDMQEPFLKAIYERDRLVSGVKKLTQAAAILKIPVLVTLQYAERMGDTIPEIRETIPGYRAVDKMTFSCCGAEPFRKELEALGRKTVVICGLEAHICVNQTVHDLLVADYRPHVPADAVSSRRPSDWQAGLHKADRSGAVLTSTEAVLFEWLQRAGTPEFKEVQRLVK
ncbi:MAG: hydrolase [Armatimonadetes bacterium]|nr:hydrolase [Armatimonadota bacterium]